MRLPTLTLIESGSTRDIEASAGLHFWASFGYCNRWRRRNIDRPKLRKKTSCSALKPARVPIEEVVNFGQTFLLDVFTPLSRNQRELTTFAKIIQFSESGPWISL